MNKNHRNIRVMFEKVYRQANDDDWRGGCLTSLDAIINVIFISQNTREALMAEEDLVPQDYDAVTWRGAALNATDCLTGECSC